MNEILSGLDIATHDGWCEAMRRSIVFLEASDAIAAEHDIGPGGPGMPIITSDPAVVDMLARRMSTYNEAAARLATLPTEQVERLAVDPDVVAEFLAGDGSEPYRESDGHRHNPVGVMAMHEAAQSTETLRCDGSGSQAIGGPAHHSVRFCVPGRPGDEITYVTLCVEYSEGPDQWLIESARVEARRSEGRGPTHAIAYSALVRLAREAAARPLTAQAVWDRAQML